jgi:hypothetical protein
MKRQCIVPVSGMGMVLLRVDDVGHGSGASPRNRTRGRRKPRALRRENRARYAVTRAAPRIGRTCAALGATARSRATATSLRDQWHALLSFDETMR